MHSKVEPSTFTFVLNGYFLKSLPVFLFTYRAITSAALSSLPSGFSKDSLTKSLKFNILLLSN